MRHVSHFGWTNSTIPVTQRKNALDILSGPGRDWYVLYIN